MHRVVANQTLQAGANAGNPLSSTLSDLQLDALREVSNIGSGNAATALSAMLGRSVDISVPTARALPLSEAVAEVGLPDVLRYGVCVPVVGAMPSIVLLLLPEDDADSLCAMFGIEPSTPDAESMLGELGNILATSYINVLAEMLQMDFEPAPPQVVHDMLGAIVQSILLGSVDDEDTALMIDSRLKVEGDDCAMSFLLVPAGGGVRELLERLGV
jgi:chemotaxis protein CheC